MVNSFGEHSGVRLGTQSAVSCFTLDLQAYDGVMAVTDLSLRVYKNQITVLLGHNGAGKTTLLKMITGFLDCTSGLVLVRGYDIKTCTRNARESIGYCPQNNILYDDLTVEENLMVFALVSRFPQFYDSFSLLTGVPHDVI
ncbi:hypothetical protein HPB48_006544 [Haemaphysalis longicornis]|uniref:ABC transporter domain-containing protein n=1 Tax=Haemaphysalis longicornis TaxID=44386 RepID=A0A9J6G041_HAELO|nr:hypothetical protein HPB48_006544 [Haemaphysalis longicornis]